jgi:lipopolysaccharide biosynthesis protein
MGLKMYALKKIKNKIKNLYLKCLSGPPQTICSGEYITSKNNCAEKANIAIVIHLYYMEEFKYILNKVENCSLRKSALFITTPHNELLDLIKSKTKNIPCVTIWLGENRGRDIGPFLRIIEDGYLDSYKYILKIHTKKSEYSKNGQLWFEELINGLMSDEKTVQKHLKNLTQNEMSGVKKYFLSDEKYWYGNKIKCEQLYSIIHPNQKMPEIKFYAGSMLWLTQKKIISLKKIAINKTLFESEYGQRRQTQAHTIERLMGII